VHSKLSVLLFVGIIALLAASCPGYTWNNSPSGAREPSVWRCYETGKKQMVKIPGFNQAWQVVKDCDEFPVERVSVALVFFYFEWRKNFGDADRSVERALNNIMIEWSNDDKFTNAYDVTGQYVENASVVGLALTPSLVWVKIRDEKLICKTSLVHELVHIAIWAKKKTDADPDHLGLKYLGWNVDHSALIQKVNNQLCQLEI